MFDFVGSVWVKSAKINRSRVHSEARVLLLLISSGGLMECKRVGCGSRMCGGVVGEMGSRRRVGRESSGKHLCGIK